MLNVNKEEGLSPGIKKSPEWATDYLREAFPDSLQCELTTKHFLPNQVKTKLLVPQYSLCLKTI